MLSDSSQTNNYLRNAKLKKIIYIAVYSKNRYKNLFVLPQMQIIQAFPIKYAFNFLKITHK